ncbi:hypothetical protein ACEPAF_2155 [Sanghuangporus sanghuang]
MSSQVVLQRYEYIVDDSRISRYALPYRNTIHISDSLRNTPRALSMPISYLAVVGTPYGNTFHFRLSLVSQTSSGGRESIRIDVRPTRTDTGISMYAIAVVEYNPYDFSWSHGPQPFIVPVAPGKTAGTFLEVIFTKYHLDQYILVDPGQGCRHWCATVLDMLTREQLVNSNVPQQFAEREAQEHARFGYSYPIPRIKGTFY